MRLSTTKPNHCRKPVPTPNKQRPTKFWSDHYTESCSKITRQEIKLQEAIYELSTGEEDLVQDLSLIRKTYAESLVRFRILQQPEADLVEQQRLHVIDRQIILLCQQGRVPRRQPADRQRAAEGAARRAEAAEADRARALRRGGGRPFAARSRLVTRHSPLAAGTSTHPHCAAPRRAPRFLRAPVGELGIRVPARRQAGRSMVALGRFSFYSLAHINIDKLQIIDHVALSTPPSASSTSLVCGLVDSDWPPIEQVCQ